jgi:hypothetical protein
MHPYTNAEWDTLPHIIMTSDLDWDPTVFDVLSMMMPIGLMQVKENPHANLFNYFGEYHYCPLAQEHDLHFFDTSGTEIKVDIDSCLDHCVYEANHCYLITNTETELPLVHKW